MAIDFVTNQEVIMAARRNLTQNVWDYLTGGAVGRVGKGSLRASSNGDASRP